ncbi:MAG: hypothetical protein R3282_06945 [Rhodothermales bacterium]|nr:hypothetical protein [Rhodothermales bacterium]
MPLRFPVVALRWRFQVHWDRVAEMVEHQNVHELALEVRKEVEELTEHLIIRSDDRATRNQAAVG